MEISKQKTLHCLPWTFTLWTLYGHGQKCDMLESLIQSRDHEQWMQSIVFMKFFLATEYSVSVGHPDVITC